ncbi:hypothetical protein GWK47_041861 [Chionoecetes opilio]|uniref:Uncharacterized protein n=1 Tax=Chionoecetes opilio TaxID=41210 RepID=A0A8J4YGK0_CHIOP|nr:hypothetical protein GWK47_041861 [Chionoecetes opilio]
MLCLTSTRRHHQSAERANRSAGTGIHFKNIQPGHNIQPVEKVTRLFLQKRQRAHQVPGRRMEKKPQHREKLEGKELYVTCEQLCFKITKEQWEEAPDLSQVKKKQTHASFSMHFMQQNLGTSLSSSCRGYRRHGPVSGQCHKSIPPVFPEVRDEEPGQIPGYHHTEPYTGRQRV